MYTSGVTGMQMEFNISSEIVVLLGLTTNLFGLAVGSVVLFFVIGDLRPSAHIPHLCFDVCDFDLARRSS